MGALAEHIRAGGRSLTLVGIVLIVLGALAMVAPLVTGVAIATLVGILVLAAGIARLVFAFQAGSLGRGILAGLLGVLTIAAGVLLIAHPLLNLAFLTLLLAAYFLVSGITEVVYAFRLRPLDGWGWLLFGGLMGVLLAVLIYAQWPLSGGWAVGVLVGVHLLVAGFTVLTIGGTARRLADRAEATRAGSPARP